MEYNLFMLFSHSWQRFVVLPLLLVVTAQGLVHPALSAGPVDCGIIAVGTNPQIPTRAGSDVYIHNGSQNTVSIIDAITDTVIATTTVGSQPFSSTLVAGKVYVNNAASDSVTAIDADTRAVVATIPVGTSPRISIAVGTNLYVNNQNSDNISVIDTNTDTVIDTITVGTNPFSSTLVGTKLYVTNQSSDNVTVVDTLTNNVLSTIPVGQTPIFGFLIGSKLYVPGQSTNDVTVINTVTDTVVATIPVGTQPFGANVVGTDLYVINTNTNDVSVIDSGTDTVTDTIAIGSTPRLGLVVGNELYVANLASDNVTVVNTLTNIVTHTIAAGSSPLSMVRVGPKLYVTNLNSNDVTVIDTITKAAFNCATDYYYALSYSAGAGGSLAGTASQNAFRTEDGSTVTAVANGGYVFDEWSDGVLTAVRTDLDLTGDITVTANFIANAPVPILSYGGTAVYGCTDRRALNFNPHATVLSTIRDCVYPPEPVATVIEPAPVMTPPVAGPMSKECFAYKQILSRGMNNAQVLELQVILQKMGHFPTNVTPNGNFGPTTQQSVRAFQKTHRISQVGPLTGAKLAALSCNSFLLVK